MKIDPETAKHCENCVAMIPGDYPSTLCERCVLSLNNTLQLVEDYCIGTLTHRCGRLVLVPRDRRRQSRCVVCRAVYRIQRDTAAAKRRKEAKERGPAHRGA